MSNVQISKEKDLDSKIKEAEVYRSMGLLSESLNVYEKILSDIPEQNAESQKDIKEKIGLLKSEISELEKKKNLKLSTKDLSVIKESLADHKNVSAILDSASAFKELGLFAEAISEYEKLFKLDYPLAKVIPELIACLFKSYSPTKVSEYIDKLVNNQKFNEKEKAEIKFRLGLEMERRDHKELALDLYRFAGDLDPDKAEIKEKISSFTATVSTGSKYDYLLNKNLVTTDRLQQALALSKKMKKSVEWVLIEQFKIKKEEVGKSLSLFHGHTFKTFKPEVHTPVELISNLKKSFLLQDLWVPLTWDKNGVEVLVDDPGDLSKTDHIKALIRAKNIVFSVGIKEDIEAYIRQFFEDKKMEVVDSGEMADGDFELMPDISFEEEEEEEQLEEFDEASGQVVKLVDQIIVSGYRRNASDIHIEPSPVSKATSVRFRLDGVCQEFLQVPNSMARGLLSRIKIMAGLDIAERRLPQDGKIKFKRKGVPAFEMRLATVPTAGNFEDAVMRILAKAGAMKIDQMNLSERNLRLLKEIIAYPYGLVLCVGPTGSGKTTTLHAALGHINKPGIKIWTAEDPIEITQPGLRQVEVKPKIGLDFARVMRSFLRADPDVIMIGEMRDHETASIGIEASLTGHLVFSTLHTNSAPETVTRLLDMGLNPLNFSDAFLGVLAQRLVRRVCKSCREEYHPSEEEFDELVTDYGKEQFETTGIEYTNDLKLYRAVGCEACSGTGYKGRLGIHELMGGSREIKKMIKRQANTENLFEQAKKEEMTTLRQDGIMKVFEGLTDIHEVRRVCIS